MRIRYLFVVVGSLGDLLPMLTIAQGLKSLGHDVTIMAAHRYANIASSCEIPFASLPTSDQTFGDREKHLLSTRYIGLWLLRYGVALNSGVYRLMQNQAGPNLMILTVNRPNLWADLYAFCHLGIPVVRFDIDPPWCLGPVGLPETHTTAALAIKWQIAWARSARLLGPKARVGHLSRLSRYLSRAIPVVPLYPSWLVGGAPDTDGGPSFVPSPASLPLQTRAIWVPDPKRPTVAFIAGTDGTLSGWNSQFFATSIEICRTLDCNGILLGGNAPADLNDDDTRVHWSSFLGLDEVLERADVVVHHGGIGTAAVAIRHAVPQVLLPRVFAQPSNARWLERVGVAEVVEPGSFTVEHGASIIRSILRDCRLRDRASFLSPHCYNDSYVSDICRRLSSIMLPPLRLPTPASNRTQLRGSCAASSWPALAACHPAETSQGVHSRSHDRNPIYLFCGIPGVGKSTFARWLGENEGFTHVDIERTFALMRLGLSKPWHRMLSPKADVRPFVIRMRSFGTPVVIDWRCLPQCVSIVRSMQDMGIIVWWFDGDVQAARRSLAERSTDALDRFDREVSFIADMRNEIASLVGGRVLKALDAQGNHVAAADMFRSIVGYGTALTAADS